MDPVPPMIDTTRQVRIESALQDAAKKSLFTPINIGALGMLLCVIFFLYKRYKDKKATEKAHTP
jgi:hypothetical protein